MTGATTMNHRYDVFGRSTTVDVGTRVVEQNAYDGYDRLVRQQRFDTAGAPTFTRLQSFDPFDRVVSQAEKVGTAQSISTRYTFVGLADQVAIEEERDTAGTWKVSKSYAYGAGGENLSLVDSPVNGSTSSKSFYGTNPHGDVETLTDATTGLTTSTYRYTAYGQPDRVGTTGDDAITGTPGQDADVVNPYRFNSKRFNGATGTYDMGFREYNPALNRFLTRDLYAGALKDLALGADPWNTNRYMFGGGNPIGRIEIDGHIDESLTSGGGRAPEPVKEKIGSRDVAAPDEGIYEEAYDAVKSKLVGDGGGQGQEYMIRCNSTETSTFAAGRRTTCGASDVYFSRLFAKEMCRQPGIKCTGYNPAGTISAEGFSDGMSVRMSGGPEVKGIDTRKPSGTYCSFSGETLVEMGDGSRRPISQVKVGDEVLATDPETGERGSRKVTHLWVHNDTLLILETDGGTLTTTEDHPFWNATDGEFQRADQLDAADELLTSAGDKVRVKGIRYGSERVATAYNLSVDDIHTYYVLAGKTPVLVHNVGECPVDGLPHGALGESATLQRLQNDGYTSITREVRFKNSQGEIFRADFVAQDRSGSWVAVEVKTGGGASLSDNQSLGYAELGHAGAVLGTSRVPGLTKGSMVSMRVEVDLWRCPVCGS
ncbi:polymorphic toxin-type HINT domain-containing protein [Kribbella turkmenica]|uniref:polymorphic toxin-type HINT domain-containing protein n=1 Tax=Kribbella turkmenica TaxID=2530375 RepID=UPI001F3F1642|nr:polymorphic toxin-type HINT domain-containing protein [Kribbella turkmenica]